MDTTKVERLMKMVRLIGGGDRVTADSLAEALGVNRRTVFRYIDTLYNAGFPIIYDDEKRSFVFRGDFAFRDMGLSDAELQVLLASHQFVRKLGAPFEEAYRSLLDRLAGAARHKTEGLPLHVLKLDEGLIDHETVMRNHDLLESAIRNRRRVEIFYQAVGADSPTARKVEPHYFIYRIGDVLLRAHCLLRNEKRLFLLDRIKDIKILDEKFRMPKGLDPEKEMDAGFGAYLGYGKENVVIKFSPAVAPLIRRKTWHPGQKMKDTDDGGVILSMKAVGGYALSMWIMSWGYEAEVLKPERLRNEIKKITTRMSEIYSK